MRAKATSCAHSTGDQHQDVDRPLRTRPGAGAGSLPWGAAFAPHVLSAHARRRVFPRRGSTPAVQPGGGHGGREVAANPWRVSPVLARLK